MDRSFNRDFIELFLRHGALSPAGDGDLPPVIEWWRRRKVKNGFELKLYCFFQVWNLTIFLRKHLNFLQ